MCSDGGLVVPLVLVPTEDILEGLAKQHPRAGTTEDSGWTGQFWRSCTIAVSEVVVCRSLGAENSYPASGMWT
jgi:hypothetical protein